MERTREELRRMKRSREGKWAGKGRMAWKSGEGSNVGIGYIEKEVEEGGIGDRL